METKAKYKVTQSNKRPHDSPPSGNGPMGQPSEDHASNGFGTDGQIIEEVTGTTENTSPTGFGTELTEVEGHMRVSNPASSRKKQESAETTAETEPVVEASLAAIGSSQDEREFLGALAGAIGPFIVNTVKKTGISLATSGIRKLSPTLSNMLRREGFSETAIQQLESGQQESGAEEAVVVGREFWEKLASACIPVFRRRPGMYPTTYPSILQPKGGINKLSDASQQEAGAESAMGEREFWGAIASALAPVLAPVAKQVAGMAIKSGTSLVKSGLKKFFDSSDQEAGADTEEAAQQLEALFLQHLQANQQEAGSESAAGEREFFGALAKKLVPVFKPLAQSLANAAGQAGTSLVKKISPKLANMLRLEGYSETAIQQLEANQQEAGSESGMGEREFWGAIASALAPVLAPVAKQVAGMAIKSGTSLIKSGIKKFFDSSDQEAGVETEETAQQLEALFLQQLAVNQQEAGSELTVGEREFFGALAKKLVPVFKPMAQSLAGSAIKAGTSWIKTMFDSSQQESGAETETTAQQLEALFLEQLAATQQETGTESAAGEREFFGALAKKIVPIFSPVAKKLASIGQPYIKRLSPMVSNMLRQEGYSETAIQQLESSQQEAGTESGMEEREFWGAIASALAPVLAPVAKQVAGMAIKSGTSLIKSGIKKFFDSSDQEAGADAEEAAQQLEALFLQHLQANQQEAGSESAAGEREFFGALAKKLVPVFKPLAQSLANAAGQAGTSLIKKISPKLANMLRLEGYSETAIQQLESNQQEAGAESAMGEQEFWGLIASALAPVLAPVAKKLAGAAVKAGTSFVKSSINKIFDSSDQEAGADTEETAQQLEALFLEQAQIGQQESSDGTESAMGEREFWGALARALTPVLKPIAGAAVKAGTSFVTSSVKKLFESSEQEGSAESAMSEREFWGALAKLIVPVLKPIAGAAVKAGTSFVTSNVKKLFDSSDQEDGDAAMAEVAAFSQQLMDREVIIGTDDRVQVTNTTNIPFRRICHLSIKAADGTSFLGTGFFIGPRTIMTAGHCVYIHEHGGWPQQIIVSPGRNVANKPYGQIVATSFGSVKGWVNNQSRNHDYGVIQLSKNDQVSPQIGSFGFGMFTDQALRNKQLSTAGYPGDKTAGTMMFHSRKATAVDANTIVYDIDTVGGQSGSAVYDENRIVVGIHTNGASSGNSATRITKAVFNNLTQWRSEGGAS